MKHLKARGPSKLGQVASGSAVQGLWLENRKVGSSVVGVDRCLLPRRRAVGKDRRKMRKKNKRQNVGEDNDLSQI